MAASDAGFSTLDALLRSYDLAELIPWARQQFIEGRTADEISLGIRDQKAFRDKYKVIFDREAAGQSPLTVSQVLEYRQRVSSLERMYGMPTGFVNADHLLLKDVSVSEFQNRLQLADQYVNTRTDVTAELERLYGLDRGHALAFVLDPDTAMPVIEREYASAAVAAQATRQHYSLTRQESESLAALGVTEAQAGAGFGQLANAGQLRQTLDGETQSITRQDELATVAGDVTAQKKFDEVARQRRAVFAEGGGFTANQGGITGLGIAGQ